MRDRRAATSSEDEQSAIGASETTPICSRVMPTSDHEGDLHINDELFARQRPSDSDVRVNVALFSAAKTGTRPIVRRPAPSVPEAQRSAPPPRMTWMAIGAAIAIVVAAISFVIARLVTL
jgi:hypothetical protein